MAISVMTARSGSCWAQRREDATHCARSSRGTGGGSCGGDDTNPLPVRQALNNRFSVTGPGVERGTGRVRVAT